MGSERVTRAVRAVADAASSFDATFTFPVVAAVAARHPDLVRAIVDGGHEVASHGLIHRKMAGLPLEAQLEAAARSKAILEEVAGSEVEGFRAPYNSADDNTLKAIAAAGYSYDSSKFSRDAVPSTIEEGGRRLAVLPIHVAETQLIDELKLSANELEETLAEALNACGPGKVVVFDLHPVRIGSQEYVGALKGLLRRAREAGVNILSLKEAAERVLGGRLADGAVAFSGDIDCVSVWDYVRRLWGGA